MVCSPGRETGSRSRHRFLVDYHGWSVSVSHLKGMRSMVRLKSWRGLTWWWKGSDGSSREAKATLIQTIVIGAIRPEPYRNRQYVLRSSSLSLFQIRRKAWRKACGYRRTLLRRRSIRLDICRRGVFLYVRFTSHVRSQVVY